ncbi:MAG: zinc ribbon domain-containing protein [Dehalococcoidia bacterium]|jgi:predicted nucleic acid-binding Zn ribbon protein
MSYCSKCGNKLEPGQNFCSNCGQKPPQEKTEKTQRTNTKKRNKWILPVTIVLLIIAIGGIAGGVVIGLNSGGNTSSNNNNIYTVYPTDTYQAPTQTYQPPYTPTTHTLMSDQTLSAGSHDPNPYTISAGKTITISWSASSNVDVYIFTDTNYNYWLQGSYICEAAKTASSDSLSYPVANTDTYYLVVKNTNTLGFGAAITVYSATATW